jgi:hypothetical protein
LADDDNGGAASDILCGESERAITAIRATAERLEVRSHLCENDIQEQSNMLLPSLQFIIGIEPSHSSGQLYRMGVTSRWAGPLIGSK